MRRLAAVGVLALSLAVATRHAELLLMAAPPLAALAAAGRRPSGPTAQRLTMRLELSTRRCFETEDIELRVDIRAPNAVTGIGARLATADTVAMVPGQRDQHTASGNQLEATWMIRPARWGKRPVGTLTVTCRGAGRVWQATADYGAGEIEVFPPAPRLRADLVPADLLSRVGDHRSRATGPGAEFAGIRPYVPGDRLRDLNPAVSARLGRWYVNQRRADRAADLVVVVDGFSDVLGEDGDSTVDTSVRGAAALARTYLRNGDRVGVVALGGMLRWLGPGTGEPTFYRIVEMLFDVSINSFVTPDVERIPRTVLPPGALAVVFSPLLDDRAVGALQDMRERGTSLVVVDVLRTEPPADPRRRLSVLALRLWRLDRAALRLSLAELGIPVVAWNAEDSLDASLAPVRRLPLLGSHR